MDTMKQLSIVMLFFLIFFLIGCQTGGLDISGAKEQATIEVLSQDGEKEPVLEEENDGDQNNDFKVSEDAEDQDDADEQATNEDVQKNNQDQDEDEQKEPDEESNHAFGQEVSAIAEGLKEGDSTVAELVDVATSKSREVLEEVKEKTPEQAQQGLEKALSKRGKGNQHAAEAAENQDQDNSDKISEEQDIHQEDGSNDEKAPDSQGQGRRPDVGNKAPGR